MDPELQAMGISLAEAAARNSAAAVRDRITGSRARKREQETIAELEEIINELIADESDLVRIAQSFEQELIAQRLTPGDVQYISASIVPVLEKLVEQSVDSDQADSVQTMMELIKPILSVETVMVFQLLGFNFRKAIGIPLTDLVSKLILSRTPVDQASTIGLQRLVSERELAMLNIVQDADAYGRYQELMRRT